jgi:hypothetical protein
MLRKINRSRCIQSTRKISKQVFILFVLTKIFRQKNIFKKAEIYFIEEITIFRQQIFLKKQ